MNTYTCAACSTVIEQLEQIDKFNQHIGCGGDVRASLGGSIAGIVATVNAALIERDAAIDERLLPAPALPLPPAPQRRRLPAERPSKSRTFRIPSEGALVEIDFIAGLYDDGTVGEVFIATSKQGESVSGYMHSIGTLISMMLQYGVPLEKVIRKLKSTRFPPEGRTGADDVRSCTSPLDLLARWLETFLPVEARTDGT